jgi:hypothetical protein
MEKEKGEISIDQLKKMSIGQPIHPITVDQSLGNNI